MIHNSRTRSRLTLDPTSSVETLCENILYITSKPPFLTVTPYPSHFLTGIAAAFRACTDPRKVNVCVGAYRDETGQPWVLPSVRSAEERLLEDNKEYLPIEGDETYIDKALQFAYGADMDIQNRVAGVQSLSGTGACRIGGQFLANFYPGVPTIYIPTPTWGNHWKIFDACGLKTAPYRYYSRATNRLDMDGLLKDLRGAEPRSIILLHACAHNPTGCDPTVEQWKQIADVIEERQHLVFFDSAYQGFASGDAEKDAFALRYFVQERQLPVMLAQCTFPGSRSVEDCLSSDPNLTPYFSFFSKSKHLPKILVFTANDVVLCRSYVPMRKKRIASYPNLRRSFDQCTAAPLATVVVSLRRSWKTRT